MTEHKKHKMNLSGGILTIDDNGQLSFSLNGCQQWQHTGPICILHYYNRLHPRAEKLPVPWSDQYDLGTMGTISRSGKSTLTIEPNGDNSVILNVAIDNLDLFLQLTLAMNESGDGFSITVNSIAEDNPKLNRILGLEILPEFGAAKTGEEGYLTLPNWFGCRCFYDKDVAREVWQTIYSSNDQWEQICNMPVFGITRTQGTLCGIVSEGDFNAQLVCRQHWEKSHHNSIHPYLVYRWQQEDELFDGIRKVDYSFAPPVSDSGEGYAFCGLKAYDFYHQERNVKTWVEKETTRPEAVDYKDRFFLKIFMAYKDPHPEGKGDYHPTCTFSEAKEILNTLKQNGVDKISAILVGWGQDGHDGMPPTRFPVDERLGGEQEMRDLISWCKEQDIMLCVHDSYGASYSCSPEHNTDDLVRHRSGEYWQGVIWSGGYSHIICPKVFVEKHTKRDIPRIAELGIHGHHHIDAVGPFMPCFSPDHPVQNRFDYCGYVHQMFETAIKHIGSVSTEMPFGPYFDVVDGFFHSYVEPFRWHLESPIGRYFYDETVPLLAFVLYDSVNCHNHMLTDDKGTAKFLDMGLTPQVEVAYRRAKPFGIPSFSGMKDKIIKCYKKWYGKEGLKKRIGSSRMTARFEHQPGVNEIHYENGVKVLINLSEENYNGLKPYGYRITDSH